jgi:MFS family permease
MNDVDCIKKRTRFGGLWRNPDFLKLWGGQAVSEIGSRITREGLPLTAVLVLGATPLAMSYFSAIQFSALLLVGIPAGIYMDRMLRRPVMIASDLARAALLLTVPWAASRHSLTMTHLYAVVALSGILTVFFDVAYQSYLPSLVARDHVLEGNSKLGMSAATAEIAGPGITGVLVQLLTAPIAILFDALSFVVSAVSIAAIRKPEPRPRPQAHESLGAEAVAGFRFIRAHPVLRPLAYWAASAYFFMSWVAPLYILYAIRVLHMGPAALGLAIAFGGAGQFLGAALSPRAIRKFGLGATFLVCAVAVGLAILIVAVAQPPLAFALTALIVQQIIGDTAFTVFNINELSLRQSVAPPQTLGRVNAAMQMMSRGVWPLGALAGGALATQFGMRTTLALSALGILASAAWLIPLCGAGPLSRAEPPGSAPPTSPTPE